jgi:hypothetical protein
MENVILARAFDELVCELAKDFENTGESEAPAKVLSGLCRPAKGDRP